MTVISLELRLERGQLMTALCDFRDRTFDLKNEPRGCPPTQVNNNELKEMVEGDPSQTSTNK